MPTDKSNDWIDNLYDMAVLDRILYRDEFREYIESNLPSAKDEVEINKEELEILREKARKYDDLCK